MTAASTGRCSRSRSASWPRGSSPEPPKPCRPQSGRQGEPYPCFCLWIYCETRIPPSGANA
ncbi:hypothetical protein BOS5A_130088 [Bosea sp. EC-HK365B]|nr:hypothetical protein BOSE21B_111241 [Bosea sp. 21B]CAD5272271.1 hypothetical protein BOSE7B_30155 [Bosea sp. 7B]VVT55982.1 hypothetical protein BOS5A_130088 [Bosea sp. EC-HK365B]VXC70022.1 hypothetical protein BOSE127_40152 [Bosea sp. 127]